MWRFNFSISSAKNEVYRAKKYFNFGCIVLSFMYSIADCKSATRVRCCETIIFNSKEGGGGVVAPQIEIQTVLVKSLNPYLRSP